MAIGEFIPGSEKYNIQQRLSERRAARDANLSLTPDQRRAKRAAKPMTLRQIRSAIGKISQQVRSNQRGQATEARIASRDAVSQMNRSKIAAKQASASEARAARKARNQAAKSMIREAGNTAPTLFRQTLHGSKKFTKSELDKGYRKID